jgi:hypothetical protein
MHRGARTRCGRRGSLGAPLGRTPPNSLRPVSSLCVGPASETAFAA